MIRRGSLVRIQPGPPHGFRHRGGLAQLGEHLLCKQGVVGSIPTSSTNISSSASAVRNTVHLVADPSGCRDIDGPLRSATQVVCCSLTIHGKRIEIVDGKSAGVKAFRHRAVNDIMIASTDIFIFEVCEYDEFDRQTRKYSNIVYPDDFAVLDDVTLVG